MSIIEQAAKRLEELRRAGVEIPDLPPAPEAPLAKPKGLEAVAPAARAAPAEAVAAVAVLEAPPEPAAPPAGQSRRVHLDLARIASAGVVTPDAPRSRVADEFRVIKRPLITNATGKGAAPIANGNLIMVTSALPGEGKSFNAVNLAMSIAMELDHTVLLVDADVARPSLPGILGIEPEKGLLDVLLGDAELPDVLLKTDVEKLTILPAGTQQTRATELLASDAMNRLLEEMASRYSDRIVIFDSPPLLLTTESRVLATHMGQVVLVVESERTTQAAVKQALATLEACPVKLAVLNKGRGGATGQYGYGQGYGYGYGYGR